MYPDIPFHDSCGNASLLPDTQIGEATDIPVLKLFEFLVASICLFMIEVRPEGMGSGMSEL
jgi:hypothetical protein